MATGELTKRVDESELGYGEALTSSGRVSAAKMYEPAAAVARSPPASWPAWTRR